MINVTVFCQGCFSNHAIVSVENVEVTTTTVDYDVFLIKANKYAIVLFKDVIICDENLLPPRAIGTLSVVTQPATIGNFPALNSIVSEVNTAATRQFRWAHSLVKYVSTVNLPANSPMFFLLALDLLVQYHGL